MNLRKTAILFAAGSMVMSSFIVNAAENDTQALVITGEVHGGKCDVSVPSTLDLGEITPEVMKTSSVTSDNVQVFSIGLSNCLQGTSAAITIMGNTDISDSGVLKNDAASPAGNVGIAFWDIQKNLLKVNQTQVLTGVIESTKTINLISGMVKVDNNVDVTPGDVSSSAQVKVDYL